MKLKEIKTWDQVREHVWTQIGDQIVIQVNNQIGNYEIKRL
jgi:hypothetical protein